MRVSRKDAKEVTQRRKEEKEFRGRQSFLFAGFCLGYSFV